MKRDFSFFIVVVYSDFFTMFEVKRGIFDDMIIEEEDRDLVGSGFVVVVFWRIL